MNDSIGKWSKQEITFTAIGDATHAGLVKWHDNQCDYNTLNTVTKLDKLKVYENTVFNEVWRDEFEGKN
ncbi:UNVERIFIED_CONTAM: hypothetical protein KB574_01860 [Streptococcus canis]